MSRQANTVARASQWELAAEANTVWIRWFGLAVGLVLVNFIGRATNQPVLNGILALGAVFALFDTLWSIRGRVFLSDWPLAVSLLEAVFIGLLCYFDGGFESPFRLYYFLSLVVCAMRHTRLVTYVTCALHSLSFATVALTVSQGTPTRDQMTTLFLMLVFMGWVTWAAPRW